QVPRFPEATLELLKQSKLILSPESKKILEITFTHYDRIAPNFVGNIPRLAIEYILDSPGEIVMLVRWGLHSEALMEQKNELTRIFNDECKKSPIYTQKGAVIDNQTVFPVVQDLKEIPGIVHEEMLKNCINIGKENEENGYPVVTVNSKAIGASCRIYPKKDDKIIPIAHL